MAGPAVVLHEGGQEELKPVEHYSGAEVAELIYRGAEGTGASGGPITGVVLHRAALDRTGAGWCWIAGGATTQTGRAC